MIYLRRLFTCYFLVSSCFILLFSNQVFSQLNQSDSLINEFKFAINDSKKLKIARKIIHVTYNVDTAKYLKYSNEAIQICDRLNNEFTKAKIYLSLGYYFSERDMFKALDYADKGLSIFTKLDSLDQKSQAFTLIGTIYYYNGNLSKSFENYFESLKINEKLNSEESVAIDYNNLAIIYAEQKNNQKALEYYFKALEIDKKHKSTSSYSNVLMNISITYGDLDSVAQELKYGLMALDSTKKYGDINDLSHNLLNIGYIYVKAKDFAKAEKCYSEAEEIITKQGSSYYLNHLYASKAGLYLAKKDNDNAIYYFKKSLENAQKEGIQALVKQNSLELSTIYKSLGLYKESLHYSEIYHSISDSLSNFEKTKRITELELQYKFDKQMEVKRKESESNQKVLTLQRRIIAFSSIALVLAVCLILVIIAHNRANKKSYQILSEQNRQIQIQSDELRVQRDQLKNINITKDKLYSIIAHDLKNPFNVIIGFTAILIEQWDETDNNTKLLYIDQMNKSAKNTFDLLQNLLEWARAQSGKLCINPECNEIRKRIDIALSHVADHARSKNISIINLTDPSLRIWVDKNMIGTVLRNLLTNAIKFTHENGSVNISSHTNSNGDISITIEDNGIGISEDALKNIFNIETHTVSHGTNNEHGTGLGLLLCKEFVEKNRGKIEVESTVDVGTKFTITFPKC